MHPLTNPLRVDPILVPAGSLGDETDCSALTYHAWRSRWFVSARTKNSRGTLGAWNLETLESANDTGNETSLVVDAAGTAHVAFRFGTDADVRYLKGTASAFAPSETVESTNNVGNFVSLDVGSTGKAFIAHYDDTTDDLRFATNRAGFWQSTLVDSGGQVGTYASIDVLNAGLVFIGYRDDGQDDARIALNIGTTSQIFTIDAVGAPGQYASIRHGKDHTLWMSHREATAGEVRVSRVSVNNTDDDCDGY